MSATTPRRVNMAPSQSPTKSSSRRVLGDLTPKAINTPSKQTNSFDAMRAQSPLKQVQTMSPHVLVGQENVLVPGALYAGKKRSIYEVEDAENVDDARHVSSEFRRGSAVQLPLRGDSFEVGKEDDLGSPTEANTPTPELEDDDDEGHVHMEPEPSQETQKSFSEYLNFSACESQPSDQPPPVAPEPEPKKPSRAETLKTRLGFARYKVETHQIAKPSLEILSTFESASTITPSTSLTTSHNSTLPTEPTSSAPNSSQPIPSIAVHRPDRSPAGPTFITINIDASKNPTTTFPKLSFIPSLPEATVGRSSRMVGSTTYGPPSSPPDAQMQELPATVSPEQIQSPTRTYARYLTPVPKRMRGGDVDVDVDIDGEGEVGATVERVQRVRERRFEEGDLTSSVVKGHVAKGLLELMQGGRR